MNEDEKYSFAQCISDVLIFDKLKQKDDRKARHLMQDQKVELRMLLSFLNVLDIERHLGSLQWYFRRYPFSRNEISKFEHLRNMYELYFQNVYSFKLRVKETLNRTQEYRGCKVESVSTLLHAVEKVLEPMLRRRNQIVHHERYSNLQVERLMLIDLLSKNTQFQFHNDLASSEYRKSQREAVAMCAANQPEFEKITDEVANFILKHTDLVVKYKARESGACRHSQT